MLNDPEVPKHTKKVKKVFGLRTSCKFMGYGRFMYTRWYMTEQARNKALEALSARRPRNYTKVER
jgi:hypothetical protein